MKKITLFFFAFILLWGVAYYFSDNSFFGLKSSVLSDDNCSSSLLQENKAEYDKSLTEIASLDSYISLNTCEVGGQIFTDGNRNNFEIAACQRKITLRNNKKTFVNGYLACQESVNAGPRVLSGNVSTDSGASHRTLIEQEENEDMHINESVYTLSLRSQGEAYIKELNYEMTLSATGGNPDINVTKAELSSTRSGTYACSKNEITTGENVTDKKYTITCRAVGDGYQTMVDGETSNFNINLDLSVSTILSSGQWSLKFMGGKFSTTPAGTEKEISRIAGVTSGIIKYTMAYVDSRDLTVELNAQEKTSSTTIPVRAVFNKLINTASVTTDDFVISGDASVANLGCANETDSDNALRTVCTLELEINEVANATNLTVDLPAGVVQDKTRGAAKWNLAATQKTIAYVFGAPKVFVWAPCSEESNSCSGLDNTPQLIVYASVGDITGGSRVSIYANDSCSGQPVHTLTATRDIPKIDLYEKVALQKDETKSYSAKINNNCSSLGTAATKIATYTYTGETIAQVNRISCMSNTTFQYDKFSVGPFAASKNTLCDSGDMVDTKKCNAWQWNATFNNECFQTGEGTLNNPYRICTAEQLQEMDNAPGKHFRLGKDLNLANTSSWFGGKGFQPIGRNLHAGFWGSLDGNGYEIQNLKIANSDINIGLFGQAQGASWPGLWVNNLKLNTVTLQSPGAGAGSLAGMAGCAIISGVEATWVNITGAQKMTGGLIGHTGYETKVLYSKVTGGSSGIVTSDNMDTAARGGGSIGGLIGRVPGSALEIRGTETNITLHAKGNGIGGLVGHLYGSGTNTLLVSDVITRGNIKAKTGSASVGWILGDASYVKMINSLAVPGTSSTKILAEGTGTVTSIGGAVWYASYSEFTNNVSQYPIQGHASGTIGGFGGRVDGSVLSQNVSTGSIGGDNGRWPREKYIGGFVGFAFAGKFTDNYSTSDIYTSHDGPASYIGGFIGMAQDMEIRRNYAANNSIQLNHNGDFSGGGFVGYIGSSAAPYTITDNYAAVSFVDNVGLYGTNPDYLGGFFGSIRKKTTDTIENNFFAGTSQKDCVGYRYENAEGDCTSVSPSALYSAQHPVYTREGSAWEFGSTWLSPVNKFPLLKSNLRV